jgi:hypothetical protein
MKLRVRIGIVSVVFASIIVATAGSVAAQTDYTVFDLGPASPVTSELPWWYVRCSSPCEDSMLMNGNGQVAIRKQRTTPAAVDSVLYWEPGMAVPITVGRSDTEARLSAMSGNGWITGTSNGGVSAPFVWSKAAGYLALCCPDYYYPLAINAKGVAVGYYDASPRRAVVWNDRTPTLLDDLNIVGKERWTFQDAQGISDDGKISGIGLLTTSTGVAESHYFVLTPTPNSGALDRRDWIVWATENAPADPPGNALDGNINTRFSTGTAQHDSQGFFVQWAGDRTIGRIRMDPGPSTGDYPRTCGIWVKNAAGAVTFVNCQADASGVVDVSFPPMPAQNVEVWQWGNSAYWWSIAEFNVFPR